MSALDLLRPPHRTAPWAHRAEPDLPDGRDPAAWVWRSAVPPDRRAADSVRKFVGAALVDRGLARLAMAATAGAVELVDHAVRQGRWRSDERLRPALEVTVETAAAYVIVEVCDRRRDLPDAGQLRAVADLCDEHGVRVLPEGRVLWFALHALRIPGQP